MMGWGGDEVIHSLSIDVHVVVPGTAPWLIVCIGIAFSIILAAVMLDWTDVPASSVAPASPSLYLHTLISQIFYSYSLPRVLRS